MRIFVSLAMKQFENLVIMKPLLLSFWTVSPALFLSA